VLRDVLCGHLDADLVSLADELLADAITGEADAVADPAEPVDDAPEPAGDPPEPALASWPG
jgi:hypothetical protein